MKTEIRRGRKAERRYIVTPDQTGTRKKLGRRVEGDRSTLRPVQGCRSISEGKLHTELDLAWRLGRVQRTKRHVANIGIEADKVRVVQEVEKFRAELESVTLLEPPVLRDREVDGADRRAAYRAFAQRAELSGRRPCERRGGQVLRCVAGMQIKRCAGVVRALAHSRSRADRVRAGDDVDWRRTEVRDDAIQLPVTEQEIRGLAPALRVRQDVDDISNEGVASIEVRIALVRREVERVARRVGERRQRCVRDRVAPGVSGLERDSFAEPAIEPQL